MDIIEIIVPNAETFEAMKPTNAAFGNPAVDTQAATMFGVATCDMRLDTALPQILSMGFGVVRPVGKSLIGALARPTRLAGHRLNAIDQREELSDGKRPPQP